MKILCYEFVNFDKKPSGTEQETRSGGKGNQK